MELAGAVCPAIVSLFIFLSRTLRIKVKCTALFVCCRAPYTYPTHSPALPSRIHTLVRHLNTRTLERLHHLTICPYALPKNCTFEVSLGMYGSAMKPNAIAPRKTNCYRWLMLSSVALTAAAAHRIPHEPLSSIANTFPAPISFTRRCLQ